MRVHGLNYCGSTVQHIHKYDTVTSRRAVKFMNVLLPHPPGETANDPRKIVKIVGEFHMRGFGFFFVVVNWVTKTKLCMSYSVRFHPTSQRPQLRA